MAQPLKHVTSCKKCLQTKPLEAFGGRRASDNRLPTRLCLACKPPKNSVTHKTCTTCGETKPIESYRDQLTATGNRCRQAKCIDCDNARRSKAYHADPVAAKWKATFKKYGLTQEQWEQTLKAQGSKCAVCPATEPGWDRDWVVDHCHTTNKVRGLVCVNCNLLIGHSQDNPETLRAAAKYLEDRR